MAERGIAGAEVIQPGADAQVAQPLQRVRCATEVLYQGGLRQLHDQLLSG